MKGSIRLLAADFHKIVHEGLRDTLTHTVRNDSVVDGIVSISTPPHPMQQQQEGEPRTTWYEIKLTDKPITVEDLEDATQ